MTLRQPVQAETHLHHQRLVDGGGDARHGPGREERPVALGDGLPHRERDGEHTEREAGDPPPEDVAARHDDEVGVAEGEHARAREEADALRRLGGPLGGREPVHRRHAQRRRHREDDVDGLRARRGHLPLPVPVERVVRVVAGLRDEPGVRTPSQQRTLGRPRARGRARYRRGPASPRCRGCAHQRSRSWPRSSWRWWRHIKLPVRYMEREMPPM